MATAKFEDVLCSRARKGVPVSQDLRSETALKISFKHDCKGSDDT